ncbi:hypothetical protein [Desulfocicer vacuolatum]|uniref:hypothetical protein n=1 Tax=Desulfocicer vacuolatum TaxID=2298 RepID=UPI001BAEE167|nr:hypothetical protein [Desulfocicer vacuolatum]
MKYSANQGCISSFVVGRPRPEYGLPVAVWCPDGILGVSHAPCFSSVFCPTPTFPNISIIV